MAQENVEITCFIKNVDNRFRLAPPKADLFTPLYVSIGPYHMNSDLPTGKEEKERNLDKILQDQVTRGGAASNSSAVKNGWLTLLNNHMSDALRYYGWNPDLLTPTRKDEFLNMLLEDGCYILSKFVVPTIGIARGSWQRQHVPPQHLEHDIIYLVENQIPFFILEKINEITGLIPTAGGSQLMPTPSHLLHLLHILLNGRPQAVEQTLATDGQDSTAIQITRFLRWRPAKQYDMVCVNLTGVDLISILKGCHDGKCKARSILDVEPRRCGIGLEFPSLYLDSETFCMLRNLIVLEQQNANTLQQYRVTAYCTLMSQLASTAEDVQLLSANRVADHLMVHADCAKQLTDLCNGIIFDIDNPTLNYLRDECVMLERRCRSRPFKWMAWMRRKYFRNPCIAVGSVIAIIITAFAVLQAVYTVLKLKGKVK
ncbi:Os08g0351200 [Oryza sativa Japonica Group]|uniref:Os08g0351200 protein n=1 Tax=Oryza sativa subsp. japonica TaxID=39947 RepID=Q0J689_ORYSJ|nr:Os08g0351200 [Oryza sativa Japonica Group]|eukprot:NP_001061612.2 Os08g0351200 [Oryza sativa Japonica Group]